MAPVGVGQGKRRSGRPHGGDESQDEWAVSGGVVDRDGGRQCYQHRGGHADRWVTGTTGRARGSSPGQPPDLVASVLSSHTLVPREPLPAPLAGRLPAWAPWGTLP